MGIFDWSIVALYGLIVIAIGIVASGRQKNTDDYFRGGRKLPWWAVGLSIIATSFSAASLLGGPGEGFNNGFLYLQLQLGDLVGYGLVMLLFLPFFINLNLTTAYEYLEKRFDAKTRSLGSLCFLLFVIARLGGLLYAAALVVSTVTGISLVQGIVLVGVVSIVYTVAGGITAVVWTDVLQFVMIFVGLGVGIWSAIAGTPGGLDAIMTAAQEGGRLTFVDLSWQPDSIYSLPTALFGYGILAFAVAGTNQQSVQRYVSCANVPSARKAIFLGWFSGLVGVAATLLLGVMIFGFYSVLGTFPEDLKTDGILSYFIVNEVPTGAAGFLVAAIFAAAMSSIDSALHSLATCLTVDFYDRYSLSQPNEQRSLLVAKALIIVWGLVGMGSAFFVAQTGESLLPFLVKYTTMFLGPLLGIFLMGVLIPRVNAKGAFYGTAIAIFITVVGSEGGWFSLPGIWQSAITAPLGILCGVMISLVTEEPKLRSLQGLTLWHPQGGIKTMGRPGTEDFFNEDEI